MTSPTTWKSLGPFVGALTLGIALGAYWEPHSSPKPRPRAAAPVVPTGAKVTTHELPQGQLLVVDVKAPMPGIPELAEDRRCFVWREPQQMSSSISCDPRGELAVDP